MIIGIVADTHNEKALTQKALNEFAKRKVELILHAGDIASAYMLSLFTGFNVKFVLGNDDKDVEAINSESLRLGFGSVGKELIFTAEGKSFIMFHGEDVPKFRAAVASNEYDYIIKGHAHCFENYLRGKSRVINPGALCKNHELKDCEFTVAVLDTENDKVEKIKIIP